MDPIKAKIIFEISTLCLIGIIIGLFVFWLYRIKPKKNGLDSSRSVSYTHLTLPTKRIV